MVTSEMFFILHLHVVVFFVFYLRLAIPGHLGHPQQALVLFTHGYVTEWYVLHLHFVNDTVVFLRLVVQPLASKY